MSDNTELSSKKLDKLAEETLTTLAAYKYIENRSNIHEVFNLSEQSTLDTTKKQAEGIRKTIEKMKS